MMNFVAALINQIRLDIKPYYIPINDTMFTLSVFWPSDTESRIEELRFSDSVSLSFKTRLMSIPVFVATLRKVNFKHGTRDGKHDDVMSSNVTLWQTFPLFFGIKDQNRFKIRKNVRKRHTINILS